MVVESGMDQAGLAGRARGQLWSKEDRSLVTKKDMITILQIRDEAYTVGNPL